MICGATDTVGSVEAIEAVVDSHMKHSEQIMTVCLWIPTIDPCTSSVTPNVNKRCPRSKWKCNQEVTWHINMCITPRKRKDCLYCCLPSHSLHWEQSSTSRRVNRSFVILNLKPWYSWNAVPRDTCGWIYSNQCQWSVIIPCRCWVT